MWICERKLVLQYSKEILTSNYYSLYIILDSFASEFLNFSAFATYHLIPMSHKIPIKSEEESVDKKNILYRMTLSD